MLTEQNNNKPKSVRFQAILACLACAEQAIAPANSYISRLWLARSHVLALRWGRNSLQRTDLIRRTGLAHYQHHWQGFYRSIAIAQWELYSYCRTGPLACWWPHLSQQEHRSLSSLLRDSSLATRAVVRVQAVSSFSGEESQPWSIESNGLGRCFWACSLFSNQVCFTSYVTLGTQVERCKDLMI